MRTIKFTKQFDYSEGHGQPVSAFRPGDAEDGVFEVSDKIAEAAIAAGAAEETTKSAKPRESADGSTMTGVARPAK